MNDEFPNNSSRSGEPEKESDVDRNIEKIIIGEATIRKPSKWRRFRSSFIAGDASSVSEYVFWNLMIPALKDGMSDIIRTFADMMIYGEKRNHFGPTSTPASGFGSTSKMNYAGISSGSRLVLSPAQVGPSEPMHVRYNPNEIIVPTRSEAEGTIARMHEILERYNAVTVSDLYRLVGLSPDYTDQNWGWTDLTGSDVRRVGDGVLIVLPTPKDLNR